MDCFTTHCVHVMSPQVRVFYTAPTLIRSLMLHGEEPVKRHDLSSLRVLGTVGEPIGAHQLDPLRPAIGRDFVQ